MEDNKSNELQKPMSLLKKEFLENVVETINNSSLPLLVIQYVLKDIVNSLKEQEKTEIAQYNQQLNCATKNNEEKINEEEVII